jgi:KipI family sensor histidine kinase inhibitor
MIYDTLRLFPFGDAALLVEFADEISIAASNRVRALDAAITQANIPGIIETIPAYRSLLIEYNPSQILFGDLRALVAEMANGLGNAPVVDAPVKQVPTMYGGEFGPDLADVAAMHHLSQDQVIAIHSSTIYTVYMLGFSPGFAYMGNVPESIATPRLASPRTRVPAGTVAIAGQQTGVYPQSTPGGWRMLGRTTIPLFDPQRDPACFFQPGDRVQFVPVDAMSSPVSDDLMANEPGKRENIPASVEIISPGMLTTVQDMGRWGFQRWGVPGSGAMDALALRAANVLVGNVETSAALEITMAGPTMRFDVDSLIAITGADLGAVLNTPDLADWRVPLWTSIYVRAGSLLEFRGQQSGCRAYLAFAGGLATLPVMKSRSTYLPGKFGGYEGRALQAGDMLSIAETARHLPAGAGRMVENDSIPRYSHHPLVRVVLGPQANYFSDEIIQTLLSNEYAVSATSDRMGLRLQGALLTHQRAKEIISNGIALGAIQVPPNAQPIILMADRQTVGGYPVIATVIRADMPLLAQCIPGSSTVRFRVVTLQEAQEIYRAENARIKIEEAEPIAPF